MQESELPLPPLPPPAHPTHSMGPLWGLDQMQAYARTAVAAEQGKAAWLAQFIIDRLGGTDDLPAWVKLSAKHWTDLSAERAKHVAPTAEPVAWRWKDPAHTNVYMWWDATENPPAHAQPLYAHPPVAPIPNEEWVQEAMRRVNSFGNAIANREHAKDRDVAERIVDARFAALEAFLRSKG